MLFQSTGMNIDEFVDLVGCSGISESNLSQFLGCFELIADNLIQENGCLLDNEDVLLASIRKQDDSSIKISKEPENNLIESSVSEDDMRQFTRAELNKKAK